MAPTSPRTKRWLVLLSLLLVLFFGIAIWNSLKFHATSVNPSMSDMATVTPDITIGFNKAVSPNGIQVTTHPGGVTKQPLVSGKQLTIPLILPLNASTYYTVTITGVTSTSGSKLGPLTYSFKPVYKDMSELPQATQQKLLQRENVGLTTNTTDPILKHLPYRSIDFSLEQDFSVKNSDPTKIYLVATIPLSSADMSNVDAAVAARKQEVLQYIQSLDLNPANYTINYIVESP